MSTSSEEQILPIPPDRLIVTDLDSLDEMSSEGSLYQSIVTNPPQDDQALVSGFEFVDIPTASTGDATTKQSGHPKDTSRSDAHSSKTKPSSDNLPAPPAGFWAYSAGTVTKAPQNVAHVSHGYKGVYRPVATARLCGRAGWPDPMDLAEGRVTAEGHVIFANETVESVSGAMVRPAEIEAVSEHLSDSVYQNAMENLTSSLFVSETTHEHENAAGVSDSASGGSSGLLYFHQDHIEAGDVSIFAPPLRDEDGDYTSDDNSSRSNPFVPPPIHRPRRAANNAQLATDHITVLPPFTGEDFLRPESDWIPVTNIYTAGERTNRTSRGLSIEAKMPQRDGAAFNAYFKKLEAQSSEDAKIGLALLRTLQAEIDDLLTRNMNYRFGIRGVEADLNAKEEELKIAEDDLAALKKRAPDSHAVIVRERASATEIAIQRNSKEHKASLASALIEAQTTYEMEKDIAIFVAVTAAEEKYNKDLKQVVCDLAIEHEKQIKEIKLGYQKEVLSVQPTPSTITQLPSSDAKHVRRILKLRTSELHRRINYNKGLSHLRLREHDAAEECFDQAICALRDTEEDRSRNSSTSSGRGEEYLRMRYFLALSMSLRDELERAEWFAVREVFKEVADGCEMSAEVQEFEELYEKALAAVEMCEVRLEGEDRSEGMEEQ